MTYRFTRTDDLKTGDFILLWRDTCDNYTAIPKDKFISILQSEPKYKFQYYKAAANGFTIDVKKDIGNVHLVLSSDIAISSCSVYLPELPKDCQEVSITNTFSITGTLSILSKDGSTVAWSPSSRILNQGSSFRYDAATKTWFNFG